MIDQKKPKWRIIFFEIIFYNSFFIQTMSLKNNGDLWMHKENWNDNFSQTLCRKHNLATKYTFSLYDNIKFTLWVVLVHHDSALLNWNHHKVHFPTWNMLCISLEKYLYNVYITNYKLILNKYKHKQVLRKSYICT